MSTNNWQRDVVKIVLYVAGVMLVVLAVPDVVEYVAAYARMLGARHWVTADSYSTPIAMIERLRQLPIAAPIARVIVGVLLAACANWLSRIPFPSRQPGQPEENLR